MYVKVDEVSAIQRKSRSAQIAAAEKVGRAPAGDASNAVATISKTPITIFKKYMKMKESLSTEEKRKLLYGLKLLKKKIEKEMYDHSPGEPMWISEEDPNAERNVIAKTFAIDGDFDPYVNKNRGIQFTGKEIDAIENFKENVAPSAFDQFMVRFETTDDFGNNTTTVIKKFRQGNQFVFTAFAKHDKAELEPEKPEPEPEAPKQAPQAGPAPAKKPVPTGPPGSPAPVKEAEEDPMGSKIVVTKTVAFTNDIQGADVLADFLRTLDL